MTLKTLVGQDGPDIPVEVELVRVGHLANQQQDHGHVNAAHHVKHVSNADWKMAR